MHARKLLGGLLALLLCAANQPPDQLCGLWLSQDGDGKLEIYQAGDTFEARIVWLKDPLWNGTPKIDVHNPDAALRSRPILGLVILRDLHRTGDPNVYKGGRIYDPKSGKTYDCQITFRRDTLGLRGFILGLPFLGRTAVWSRAK